MLILKNVYLPLDTDFGSLNAVMSKLLKTNIEKAELYRRSVDSRDKSNVRFCCSVLVSGNKTKIIKNGKKYSPAEHNETPYVFKISANKPNYRPVVVGFGPAGMFASFVLAKAGLDPIVIEQGKRVDDRMRDIEAFQKEGRLNTRSNIQFGEGGAGTFSDGKLNSGINHPYCRMVLKQFVRFGADESILYKAKPHIGTDVLAVVVKNMRQRIIELGGEVRFENKLVDIASNGGGVSRLIINGPDGNYELLTNNLVMAIGHSSRDTFSVMYERGFQMAQKPFAVGARIEHLQENLNRQQYGNFSGHPALSAADYKLNVRTESGRGVYTFCMCPGGYVVNGASDENCVVTNGMSYNARSGVNANSALLVGVDGRDFESEHPLAGVYFQEKIERAAYAYTGSYSAVCQTVGDFLKMKPSREHSTVIPTIKPEPVYGSLDDVLPEFVANAMREGIVLLNRKLPGFSDAGALLTGPETRSSSPVRILRGENGQSSFEGVYPCGEGAGYAGGIMSAAVDGIKIAEQIINKIG